MEQAKAKGTALPISPKVAFMVCQHLRGKKLSRAKNILKAVIDKKEAIPFTRFSNGVGHRRGKVGPGRFPLKASEHILKLLESAEKNAIDIGMDENLVVAEIRANRASQPMRQGRQSRRVFKRTHVYVTLVEDKTEKKAPKKAAKKAVAQTKEEPKKTAAKKEAPKKTTTPEEQ